MSYIIRPVYKERISYLVRIDRFHLYSIITSLVQLTGELTGVFTVLEWPVSMAYW